MIVPKFSKRKFMQAFRSENAEAELGCLCVLKAK